jgi:hypothetical protein
LLSQLRFPPAMPSLVALALVVPLLWLFTRPNGSHVSGVAGLAGEMVVAGGTLLLAVIVIALAPLLLFRPSPAVVWMYPWIALAIVAGDTVLWPSGYWQKAAEVHDIHYMLAPWLAWTSVAALAPACVGQVRHLLNGRRE